MRKETFPLQFAPLGWEAVSASDDDSCASLSRWLAADDSVHVQPAGDRANGSH